MNDLVFFIKEGINHILDIDGLDHFYFIVSFCLPYNVKEIKKIAYLVTAFTVGHSITLILASLDLVSVNSSMVEKAILLSILVLCVRNYYTLFLKKKFRSNVMSYIIICFFGLIHGLGFSTYIKEMLFDGDNYLIPILGFNIGIELAQLLIVFVFISLISFLFRYMSNYLFWIRIGINTTIAFIIAYTIA